MANAVPVIVCDTVEPAALQVGVRISTVPSAKHEEYAAKLAVPVSVLFANPSISSMTFEPSQVEGRDVINIEDDPAGRLVSPIPTVLGLEPPGRVTAFEPKKLPVIDHPN